MLAALYPLLRPLLFRLNAESAHDFVAFFLRRMHRSGLLRSLLAGGTPPTLPINALGQEFSSPVLLAAGFDKHASMYNAFAALGFGGVEVGTITAHAQPGNDRPRLFRLPLDRALINRMGFNNIGATGAAAALRAVLPEQITLGVNIGKSKITAVEQAHEDYAQSAALLSEFARYVVINVSSPNTPGLRSLQAVESLLPIVNAVREAQVKARAERPLLVKIAPDLADEDVVQIAEFAVREELAGLIATNTTIARDGLGLRTPIDQVTALGAGGLSGPPVKKRAREVLRLLRQHSNPSLTLIAAGGIETADDAWDAITAGASLVQVYTGLIFRGPAIAREITAGLTAKLHASGFTQLSQAVGSNAATAPESRTTETTANPQEA